MIVKDCIRTAVHSLFATALFGPHSCRDAHRVIHVAMRFFQSTSGTILLSSSFCVKIHCVEVVVW